jgi:hypothetical protein
LPYLTLKPQSFLSKVQEEGMASYVRIV